MNGRNYLLGQMGAVGPVQEATVGHDGDVMSLRMFNIMATEAKTRRLEKCVNQVISIPLHTPLTTHTFALCVNVSPWTML